MVYQNQLRPFLDMSGRPIAQCNVLKTCTIMQVLQVPDSRLANFSSAYESFLHFCKILWAGLDWQ